MENKPSAAATTTTSPMTATDDIKPAIKIERTLAYQVTHDFIKSLESEKAPIFAHALPSTMSNGIWQYLRLEFTRTGKKARNYNRLCAIYCRYRLTENNTDEAKQVINQYQFKRGAAPCQWEGTA